MKEKIAELNLPDDFNIHGYENLLPCCPIANYQKGNLILSRPDFYLGIATARKDIVEFNLDRIEKRQNRGKASILLQQQLELGNLSHGEVAEILQQYSERPEVIFELIESMQFANSSEVKSIAKADIDSLWDLPICLGEYYIEGLPFTNEEGKQIFVRTCREYEFAYEQGYLPKNNAILKMSASFIQTSGLLKSLQSATLAQHSFISNPKVGIIDIELLPISLFPLYKEDFKSTEFDTTYQCKVREGELIVKGVSQNSLIIEGEAMGQRLIEVVRADFNNDGVEDILLFEYCYAIGGTLGYGVHLILTRKSSDGKFDIVE